MSGKHSKKGNDSKNSNNRNSKQVEKQNAVKKEEPKKQQKVEENTKPKKERKGLKAFLIIILILLIILLGVGAGAYVYVRSKLGKMQQVDINIDELDVNEDLKGYRNIALFGVDSSGDSNLGKGNRSDCIIIASINQETKDVKLISVYRDTYVQIEGHGLDKITHAYSYGEAHLAIKTLNTNLDLNIKEFATVNFSVLIDAIEELGGIEIEIEKNEIKYMNDYIDSLNQTTHHNSAHITKAGLQKLDGVQAVGYSRVRYTEGGEHKRTERMRTVLQAMVKKLKTKSVIEINNFMDKVLPKVYTNISASSIIAMVPDLLKYNITGSIGWPYDTQGITLDRWYGIPVTLESNVKQLHQEAFDEQDYEVPGDIKTISDKIVSKTGYRKMN